MVADATNQMTRDLFRALGYRVQDPATLTTMELKAARTWANGREWQRGQCMICGGTVPQPEPVEATDVFTAAVAAMPVTVCDRCEPLAHAHYSPPATGPEFEGDWETTCPKLYRRMIMGEIAPHSVDRAAYDAVTRWRPASGRGMILIGESGMGKTLSIWALKRELEHERTRCDIYTAVEIARELSKHARELEAAYHLWRTKVLVIDDLGKEPITAAAAALLWELVDRRYSEQVPTIITTRFKGQAFVDRFREPALGGDIRRRIRDACAVVQFTEASHD